MSNDRLDQFEKLVAGIVSPLAASGRRKRRIAEELLAHLWQAYEEERARNDDDDAAAQAAVRRLGDTGELSSHLQTCVSFSEIILSLGKKEILMSRWFWLCLGVVVAFFGTGLVLPALAKYKESGNLPMEASVFLAAGALIVLAGIFIAAFAIRRLVARRA